MAAFPDADDRTLLASPSPQCSPGVAMPPVYCDGACPLCRVAIARYRWRAALPSSMKSMPA